MKQIKEARTLTKVIIAVFIFVIVFDAVVIPIYYTKDWNMDTIVTMNLGAGGIECLLTAAITIAKTLMGKNE